MGINGESESNAAVLSIEERDGAVVVFIGTTYAILPPEQAMAVGELLTRYGYHAKTGQEVQGKKIMSEMIQNKLYQRASLMIKNLTDRKTKPMRIAKEVVDAVLREVT